jgi:DNA polymerase I-like protein with 3'-5' exonuclease and polymerase domains
MQSTQLPLLGMGPQSDWEMPTDFPDLVGRGAKWLSIDIETCDPRLKADGPGFIRGDAYVAGVAVRADGFSGYYPVKHRIGANLSKKVVASWVQSQLKQELSQGIFGANLFYDLGGLKVDMGVDLNPNTPIYDIQIAEPLIDENTPLGYSLDVLGKKYLGVGKDEALLLGACQAYGLGKLERGVRSNYKGLLHVLPAKFVAPYAETDTALPPQIFALQKVEMERQGLWPIFNDLERQLTPMLLSMWQRGVRVDIDRVVQVRDTLVLKEAQLQKELDELGGMRVEVLSNDSLAKLWKKFNEPHPLTAAGNPSFTKDWLQYSEFLPAKLITELRKVRKIRSDFLESAILGTQVKGRIHPTINQLKKDDGGTVSGRFSYRAPNLQQIPARDPYYGPLMRSMFLPEEGCQWACLDYSQQEFRITIHYAYIRKMKGAAEARQRYLDNPNTDFHQLAAEMANLTRSDAKIYNLGKSYNMGTREFARQNNKSMEEATEIDAKYDAALPFIKLLNREATNLAETRGWVRTILGRVGHFDLWEPQTGRNEPRFAGTPLPLEQAQKQWSGRSLKRAGTHKAYNRIDQGTAADQIKKSMLDCWKEGLDIDLVVHDENDFSFDDPKKVLRVKQIMLDAIQLQVPMKVDVETGPNWGTLTKPEWAL